jgi:biotin carboxyl carrier protein
MMEPAIEPKTPEAVIEFINGGGKLMVGGDVLVGLQQWQTLVPKPPVVDRLLENMSGDLTVAMSASSKLIGLDDLPHYFGARERYTVLGYQQKGLDLIKMQGEGKDLTPLLAAPHILHRQPRTLTHGSRMTLLVNGKEVLVEFLGFGKAYNGDITVGFAQAGQEYIAHVMDPNAVVGASTTSGPRRATPGNPHEYGTDLPGEVLAYNVKVGDILEAGAPMVVLESMKMEVRLSVPDKMAGFKVKSLPCKGRTATDQGDILKPGDLLLETEDA